MTRTELIEKVGDEFQAGLAIDVLLKNVKFDFIRMAINTEFEEVIKEIEDYEERKIIYYVNGSHRVSWNPDNNKEECRKASNLLSYKNRLISLLSK